MRIETFFDNALFIRNWRERMRLYFSGSAVCLTFLIIILIFVGNYLNRDSLNYYDYTEKKSIAVFWLNNALFQLAVLQGIILFLSGVFFAAKMAGLEKTSGTLEFHRSAPSGRLSQIIGLVFGAPVLEWCLFLGILPIVIFAAGVIKADFLACFSFYVSLIISALFYHSLAVLYALCANPKRYRAAGIFIILYLFIQFGFVFSFAYHLTPFPAYSGLYDALIRQNGSVERWNEWNSAIHLFFGCRLPYLLLQFIVQVPLLVLFWLGIKRKFEYGERPVWSKAQSAVFAALTLFYFTGSFAGSAGVFNRRSTEGIESFFWFTAFILMFITAPLATPTQLGFIKGLRRAHKLGVSRLGLSDDYSPNRLWLITFCFIIAAMFAIYCLFFLNTSLYAGGIFLAAGLCYIVFFCQILEYFYLSKYHQKRVFLFLGLAILWLIIPVFGFITKAAVSSPYYLQYFLAPSPFFGMVSLTSFSGKAHSAEDMVVQPAVYLIITFVLAVSAALLNRRQQSRLRKEISCSRSPRNYCLSQ